MNVAIITSSQNPVVKEVKALKERKNRESKKLFFIEGTRFVEEALKEAVEIEKILVSEGFASTRGGAELLSVLKPTNYTLYQIPDKVFKELSDTENPQGILAVIKAKAYALSDIFSENNFLIILDTLQDPGNMGTILRTADAAGANGVILSKGCVDLYNPKVLRSTMGSVFHIPVCYSENLNESIQLVKSQGIKVYAAHLKGDTDYFDINMKNNVAIIIGNEANGIRDEIAACADGLVRIPMPGRSESLNASVAAGLLMYEVVRQRTKG